jgi:hypothetical protein
LFRNIKLEHRPYIKYWWQFVADECAKIYGQPQDKVSTRDIFLRIGVELDLRVLSKAAHG